MELVFNVNDSNIEIQDINKSDKHNESEGVPREIVEDNDLVQLVRCAIHRGKWKDPRKLICQHVFCYVCLKKLFDIHSELICPICRKNQGISDVNQLPLALTENQLLELISKNGIKNYSSIFGYLSDEEVEKISKYLLKQTRDEDGDIEGDIEGDIYGNIDAAITKEYMLDNAKYECVKEYSSNILHNVSRKMSNIESDFTIFDILMVEGQPKSLQLVLLDCPSNELIWISEINPQKFHIKIDNQIVQPEYIRIFKSTLVLSGKLTKDSVTCSVFLQCNMNGEILHQSELIPWLDSSSNSSMLGFDIDNDKGLYYLSMPQSHKVAIYNSSMVESDFYELGDNQPEYVAICFENNQLWISCSQNRRILIVNRETESYKTINADSTIPKMIFSTNDEKIIYLDTSRNTLIWIYLDDNVYYRPLELVHRKTELVIKSIQILPSSQIIINTGSEILIFQSTKCISRWFRNRELCSIL